MSDAISKKVQAVAKQETERVKDLTTDAAKSGSYLYPIKGILYFIAHRSLWKPLLNRLAPTVSLGVGITSFMFFFTYLPQAAVLTLFEGPFAPISAILLVLSESSTLLNYLSKNFVISDALVDTFDGTLVSKGCTALVSGGRQVKAGQDPIGKLGKMVKKPFSSFTPSALIRYCLYLPLNLIPVVGTVLFVIAQGKRAGPEYHARYFQLRGYNAKQQSDWVEKSRGAYTGFGIAASVFEMVPVAGIFLSFTNAVGAAMWAADMEKRTETTVDDAKKGR